MTAPCKVVAVAAFILPPAPASSLPPPSPADRAGCATSTFIVDRDVCAGPDLRSLDARLRWLLTSHGEGVAPGSTFIEPDEAWFSRRNQCAFQSDQRRCLAGAYAERRYLADALQPPPAPAVHGSCGTGFPGVRLAIGSDSVAAYDDQGRIIALGALQAQPVWREYVSVRRSAKEVRFTTIDGATIRCSLQKAR